MRRSNRGAFSRPPVQACIGTRTGGIIRQRLPATAPDLPVRRDRGRRTSSLAPAREGNYIPKSQFACSGTARVMPYSHNSGGRGGMESSEQGSPQRTDTHQVAEMFGDEAKAKAWIAERRLVVPNRRFVALDRRCALFRRQGSHGRRPTVPVCPASAPSACSARVVTAVGSIAVQRRLPTSITA